MYGPGIYAPDQPTQENISASSTFNFKETKISPLADFEITAKVLSRKNYTFDETASISPIDLALGWGRMSDEKVLDTLHISQSNRWYHWNTDKLIIPRREIETHSANMHMIPSTQDIEVILETVKNGDIIHLKGQLVRVDNINGSYWKSSTSRTDTGAGACEIIFVTYFEILNPILNSAQ